MNKCFSKNFRSLLEAYTEGGIMGLAPLGPGSLDKNVLVRTTDKFFFSVNQFDAQLKMC